jgi:Mn-dependent DtxR family transcriptional regulator
MKMSELISESYGEEKPESGYLTVTDWAIKLKVGRSTMQEWLQRLVKEKKVTIKYFRIKIGCGNMVRKTAHFKEA